LNSFKDERTDERERMNRINEKLTTFLFLLHFRFERREEDESG